MNDTSNIPELRDYQADLWARIGGALGDHKSVCLQLPTGGGKSVILAECAIDWPGKIFWATHRQELVTQSSEHLQRAGRHDAIVTSPIKLWNRIESGKYRIGDGDLLIVDEAHHSAAMTWERMIKTWPGSVLGATATPWRLSKKEGLDHIFDDLICGPQVQALIDDGYLAHAHVKLPHEDKRIKGAGNNGGDYSELATWNANSYNIMVEEAIDWLLLHNPERAIVYACGEEHAIEMMNYLGDRRRAALVTAKTDAKERESIFTRFRNGDLDTLFNIMIATEGCDIPECDCVVLGRDTKSLALYMQMVGRALRPKANGKPALILDCCGMSLEHGLPEDDRTWSLAPRGDGEPGKQWRMPVCAECGTCNSPMQKYCIGCGVQRWHTCDRCSKPVFHEDGEDTECERCNPLNDELMKMYHDDYGHPIWCAERDRPILGYTKISRGLYAGLFGAIWRYNVAHAPILETGTVITMKSKKDNETGGKGQRTAIVELIDRKPWGAVYATTRTVKDVAKQGTGATGETAGADKQDYAAQGDKSNSKESVDFW